MDELMHSEGILGAFFSILWHKGVGKRMHQLTGVNIPDTILYLYSKPLHWYFSCKNGEIKKKSRSRLNSRHIEEQFLKNGNSVSGIKASYLMAVASDVPNAEPQTRVKYTFGHELRKFLQEDKPNGVLQLFFDPKPEVAREGTATKNSLVQTTWSPGCFFIEKRVNKHRLDQHKVPVEVRAATFDDYKNTETVPLVSDSVAGQFQKVCQLIADHIRVVFKFKLASLVLNFKIDRNDTIWLLWCSSIRIVSEEAPSKALTATTAPPLQYYNREMKKRELDQKALKKYREENKKRLTGSGGGAACNEAQRCPLCTQFHSGVDLCRVPVKTILTALAEYDDSAEPIPPPLLLLYPTLTRSEYQHLLSDPSWPNSLIPVCCVCVQSLVHCAAKITLQPGGGVPRLNKILDRRPSSRSAALAIVPEGASTPGSVAGVQVGGVVACNVDTVSQPVLPLLTGKTLDFYTYDQHGTAARLGYAVADEDDNDDACPAATSLTPEQKRSLFVANHYSLPLSAAQIALRLGVDVAVTENDYTQEPTSRRIDVGSPPPSPKMKFLLEDRG